MLKIRSTPTEAKQTGYMNSQLTEPEKAESHLSYTQYGQRLCQGEFPRKRFTRLCAIDIAQIRQSSSSSF